MLTLLMLLLAWFALACILAPFVGRFIRVGREPAPSRTSRR